MGGVRVEVGGDAQQGWDPARQALQVDKYQKLARHTQPGVVGRQYQWRQVLGPLGGVYGGQEQIGTLGAPVIDKFLVGEAR